jgi:hypothetical protein
LRVIWKGVDIGILSSLFGGNVGRDGAVLDLWRGRCVTVSETHIEMRHLHALILRI